MSTLAPLTQLLGAVVPETTETEAGVSYGHLGDDRTGELYQSLPVAGDITIQIVGSDAVVVAALPDLRRGDDYVAADGSAYRLRFLDSAGDPTDTIGNLAISDATATVRCDQTPRRNEVQDFVGAATWIPASGGDPPQMLIEFPRVQTLLAQQNREYDVVLVLQWSDPDYTRSFLLDCVTALPEVRSE